MAGRAVSVPLLAATCCPNRAGGGTWSPGGKADTAPPAPVRFRTVAGEEFPVPESAHRALTMASTSTAMACPTSPTGPGFGSTSPHVRREPRPDSSEPEDNGIEASPPDDISPLGFTKVTRGFALCVSPAGTQSLRRASLSLEQGGRARRVCTIACQRDREAARTSRAGRRRWRQGARGLISQVTQFGPEGQDESTRVGRSLILNIGGTSSATGSPGSRSNEPHAGGQ